MPHPVPDWILVINMLAGDRRALTQLRQRYFLTLYAEAYGMIYDAEATEALVEEVLEAAWSTAHDYRPARFGSVHGWLLCLLHDRTPAKRSAPWIASPIISERMVSAAS